MHGFTGRKISVTKQNEILPKTVLRRWTFVTWDSCKIFVRKLIVTAVLRGMLYTLPVMLPGFEGFQK